MGDIPSLPDELREIIFNFTFPRTRLRCARCKMVILVESVRHVCFTLRQYSITANGAAICGICHRAMTDAKTKRMRMSLQAYMRHR